MYCFTQDGRGKRRVKST